MRLRAALETHLTKMGHLYDFSATSKDFKRRAGRLQTYARLLPDDFGVQMSATADIRLIEALRVEILSIEKAVMRHAKDFDRELLELLQTIPGLGSIIYLSILYEADDFSRFADCGHFISYCRLVTRAEAKSLEQGIAKTATRISMDVLRTKRFRPAAGQPARSKKGRMHVLSQTGAFHFSHRHRKGSVQS